MSKFIKACECPRCGKVCKSDEIVYDLTTEKNVVTLNNFNDTAWYCDDCGIDFGVGYVEDIIEEF